MTTNNASKKAQTRGNQRSQKSVSYLPSTKTEQDTVSCVKVQLKTFPSSLLPPSVYISWCMLFVVCPFANPQDILQCTVLARIYNSHPLFVSKQHAKLKRTLHEPARIWLCILFCSRIRKFWSHNKTQKACKTFRSVHSRRAHVLTVKTDFGHRLIAEYHTRHVGSLNSLVQT